MLRNLLQILPNSSSYPSVKAWTIIAYYFHIMFSISFSVFMQYPPFIVCYSIYCYTIIYKVSYFIVGSAIGSIISFSLLLVFLHFLYFLLEYCFLLCLLLSFYLIFCSCSYFYSVLCLAKCITWICMVWVVWRPAFQYCLLPSSLSSWN